MAKEYDANSLFDSVHLNLAVVMRGDMVTIRALHGTLQQYAKELGFKIVYIRVGSQKLFITTKPPTHLEEET